MSGFILKAVLERPGRKAAVQETSQLCAWHWKVQGNPSLMKAARILPMGRELPIH